MVCIFGMGSCGNKQEVKKKFKLDVVNKNVFSQVSKNAQKVSATNTNIATLSIEIGIAENCPISTLQEISATTTSDAQMIIKEMSTVKSNVANDLTQSAMDELNAHSGWFSTTENKQNTETEVKMAVKNIVERTFSSENIQNVVSTAFNVENGKLKIGHCMSSPVDMKQDITSAVSATAMMDSLLKNIVDDATLNKIAQDLSTKATAKTDGPIDAVSGFFSNNKWLVFVCGIVSCVLLIVILYIALSPGGQEAIASAPQAAAGAGAAR